MNNRRRHLQRLFLGVSALTILLPSTAPSALSRRSGSVCATLMGKMIPADLGRFFRPYGAEHMHAHPPPEPSQTQTDSERNPLPTHPSFLLFIKKVTRSDAGRVAGLVCVLCTPAGLRRYSRIGTVQRGGRTGSSSLCISAERRVTFSPSWRPRGRLRRLPPRAHVWGGLREREPTAKQVVTHRPKINCLWAAVVQENKRASPVQPLNCEFCKSLSPTDGAANTWHNDFRLFSI